MTLYIGGDNHNVARMIPDDIHVPIIVYRDTTRNDKSISDIINSDMSGLFYVATSGEKLYYTDYCAGTVTCCDLHGKTQWEFTDEHGLRGSSGISVDNDGNVYVVGYHSSNVAPCHKW
jgi:hypothetical protein